MKKTIFVLIIFLSFIFLSLKVLANSVTYLGISNEHPQQGDAVAVFFSGNNLKVQSANFDGQEVSFIKYKKNYVAFFGIPPSKIPGKYLLKINFVGGEVFQKQITVLARKFPIIVLGIPKTLGLQPKNLVSNLNIQNTKLNEIFSSTSSSNVYFNQPFGLPLVNNTKISSGFGEIRKTGNEKIRHLGVDFDAKAGSVVAAINDGIIKDAYFDPIYGNSIIIDHGAGIFSAYLHLSKMFVKKGESVKRGTIIGLVGQTGYATGPHLHLSIKINDVSVDPLRFVSIFK